MKISDDIIAGTFAGITARMISAPFDVLKIRSQLQVVDKLSTSNVGAISGMIQGIYRLNNT